MDDEVQYLGTNLAPPTAGPCDSQQPVTGITLHVDPCGEKPAHNISFFKTRTFHVNIGRKSISDDRSMRKENDDQNAVFACPVVSAKHAKLVLASSGHVYIVDLKSRHGTHLRKQCEIASRMLQPEVETTLADGDILTFGKAVGQSVSLVSPVTARIEFLHDVLDTHDSPRWCLTPADPLSHEVRPRKLSSGRYGLNSPISSPSSPPLLESLSSSPSGSSNEVTSHSEHDSDIEEIPSWEELRTCVSSMRPEFSADFINGTILSKIPSIGSLMQDICQKIVDPDIHLPQPWIPAPPSIDDDEPSSNDRLLNSQAHSPMELSTPSPSPRQDPEQPKVVGAWPASRADAPQPALRQADGLKSVKLPSMSSFGPSESGSFQSFTERLLRSSNFAPSAPEPSIAEVRSDEPPQDTGCDDCEDLCDSIKTIEDRVNALQSSVTDIRNHNSLAEDDLCDLQHKIDTLEPDSDQLLTRLEAAEHKLSSLSNLQNQVSELQSRIGAENSAPSMTDVKACTEALNALVIEMKLLREETETRVEERIQTVQTAKTEALSLIAAEVESFKSLKRKHSEIDVVPHAAKTDIVVEALPAFAAPKLPMEEIRPQKRPRRLMTSIAHTAAAVAVGAVATWSALAFA